MTDRMEEIGDRLEAAACVYPATIDGHAALFNAIGERDEHAADDLVFLWERCASLEALVRELATNAAGYMEASRVFDAAMKDGGNVHGAVSALYGYESMLEATLSNPIVSELTGEKVPEDCPNCFEGKSDMDHPCRKCNGTGKLEGRSSV